jgi:hypothetical protein
LSQPPLVPHFSFDRLTLGGVEAAAARRPLFETIELEHSR